MSTSAPWATRSFRCHRHEIRNRQESYLRDLNASVKNRCVKRCPIAAGECIHFRPVMKQHLLAQPIVKDLIRIHTVYLRHLNAVVDRCHVQSGLSIDISDINSCLVLYQRLQTATRNRRTTSPKSGLSVQWPCLSTLRGAEHGGRVKQGRALSQLRSGFDDFESGVGVQSSQEKRLGVKEVVLPNSAKHFLRRLHPSGVSSGVLTVPRSCLTPIDWRSAPVSLSASTATCLRLPNTTRIHRR